MNHKEAFALMHYGCECGHRERIWNSRDGVTPFGAQCPSCGEASLYHVNWSLDECKPHHIPYKGQRVWVDMTRESAERYVRDRMKEFAAAGQPIDESKFERLVANVMGEHGGAAPDLVVTGYERT